LRPRACLESDVRSGPRLVAFFAVIYYAGLRPDEAGSLRRDNITLPSLMENSLTGKWEELSDNWGELRFELAPVSRTP
jgi:integrase